MKRYRIYQQEKARMHKIKGRQYGLKLTVPACGFDELNHAENIANELARYWDKDQFCIIDFKTGKIVKVI